jgi:mannose/fructose/N-acetylgalactosamine-specific phosphotransferase system component IIC
MTAEQIYGVLRNVIPLITAVLVGWGLDDATSGLIAGGVLMLIAAAWSILSNRQTAVAKQAVGPGVEVVVGPTAPPSMRELARDPKVVGVVPK